MEKILKTTKKIRFQDCDPFNHLNNARYLDYFLNAREDQLIEHYQLSIYDYLQTYGKGWVVASNQISYLKPARTMETVLIESCLLHYTNKTLLVEMKMWDKTETELKAILWTKFMHVDIKLNRITNHSEDLMKLFQLVVLPGNQTHFEERCTELIQELKSLKSNLS